MFYYFKTEAFHIEMNYTTGAFIMVQDTWHRLLTPVSQGNIYLLIILVLGLSKTDLLYVLCVCALYCSMNTKNHKPVNVKIFFLAFTESYLLCNLHTMPIQDLCVCQK